MIKTSVIKENLTYDGSQLSSLWAFKHCGLQGDSIVAFRGACRVKGRSLVDIADQMAGFFIYSPDMLHFIAEHFDNDLEKAVLRQRLLVTAAKEEFEGKLKRPLSRRGDDLFAEGRKLSVSIATITPVSTMIHLGINISCEEVPVPAIGLIDLGLQGTDVFSVAEEILAAYAEEMKGVYLARCKVRGVT